MQTKKLLQEIILDAAHGDYTPLVGLIDYLLNDRRYSRERLARFAVRRLHLPWESVLDTLDQLGYLSPGTKLH